MTGSPTFAHAVGGAEARITPISQLLTSPKLSTFGARMPTFKRIKGRVLSLFAASGRAVFKFVVSTVADLDEIAHLVAAHGLAPVYVMPEGRTAEEVTRRLAQIAPLPPSSGASTSPPGCSLVPKVSSTTLAYRFLAASG